MDKENSKLLPKNNQITKVTSDIAITTGTKIPLILSASLDIGAFELLASSTREIILDKVVSSPINSAL
ncbi:hypothetical protein SDC9_176529 [bioreactor metagenome]|uniref:Uncharacterized protein n=1 Tax=bioreactor metagenome TaxID=1076179 RepID=A0A645GS29_9ZZZZ